MRARVTIEQVGKGDRQAIVVTELPFQVNKARLIERIAQLVREKLIDGIASDGLRDESDKDGMRVVIELKRGEVPEVLLNNLFAQTTMETVFGINMVALVDGQPRLLSLKEMLDAFLRHRREVVTRRTVYELRKARAPVPFWMACAASSRKASGVNASSTPSMDSSLANCLVSALRGSVRMETNWSSFSSDSTLTIGRRPMNSGMKP